MLRVALRRRVGAKAWGRVSASSRTADATRRARQLGLTARVRCPECRRLREPRNVSHAGSNGSFPPKWTSGMGYPTIRTKKPAPLQGSSTQRRPTAHSRDVTANGDLTNGRIRSA